MRQSDMAGYGTNSTSREQQMTSTFVQFNINNIVPEEASPAEDRILRGKPVALTWNVDESPDGKLFTGLWEATPGAWRVRYDEWEFCEIESGHSVVTPDGGEPIHLRAGDRLVLRPGFTGVWEVMETTRKSYVIRLP
jgi:uncharacterized cupin superfamily protein